MAKIQHLAISNIFPLGVGVIWLPLRPACADLRTLTLVGTWDLHTHLYDEEWQLFKIPSGVEGLIKLQDEFWSEYDFELRDEAVTEHGCLAWSCVDAKYSRKTFSMETATREEWEGIAFEYAILSIRKGDSSHWKLFYLAGVVPPTGPWTRHWHGEPILQQGDGLLSSCGSAGVLPKYLRCFQCRVQRFISTNDAFWLDHTHNGQPDEDEGSEGDDEDADEVEEENTESESEADATEDEVDNEY